MSSDKEVGSTFSGALASALSWSPLPSRKKLTYVHPTVAGENDFYPKSDFTLWLRNCKEEILEPIEGQVKGEIPTWLKGSLFRNGPGLSKVGDESFQHLFDVAALLHRFEISDGKVRYQSRFLQSEIFKKNMKANRITKTEFATKSMPDPCESIFKRVSAAFTPKELVSDNSVVSVYPFGDDLFAFGEGPIIHKINKKSLNVDGRADIYDSVGFANHTSHPHVTTDGTVFNLGMMINLKGPHHSIACFPKSDTTEDMFEKASIVAKIPARWSLNPSYMHTFGLTDNYFIIVEQPLSLSIPSLINGLFQNNPAIDALNWYDSEMCQFNVICRKTGQCIRKFYSETFFYFHIINQYEKDDCIIIDICVYKDPAVISGMYLKAIQDMQDNSEYAKMFRAKPIRFILPMGDNLKEQVIIFPNSKAKATVSANGNVMLEPELICNLGCELPRIHYERYLGKEYRYFYAVSADIDMKHPGGIIKVDTKEKTYLTWSENNCYPGEAIFVPRPNSQNEDDGVILSTMLWGSPDTNHVGLLILDAKTYVEIARAEFSTPGPVPKCFHGWFLHE